MNMILNIILGVLLVSIITLFTIFYYQVYIFNNLYKTVPNEAEIVWDIMRTNKFNIPDIISELHLEKGTRLYTKNKDQKAYLEDILETNDNSKQVKIRLIDDKFKTVQFVCLDKYGIDVSNKKIRRKRRNCQIYLTTVPNKLSWLCVLYYKKRGISETKELNINKQNMLDSIKKYCNNLCVLCCTSKCPIKVGLKSENGFELKNGVKRFCKTICISEDCKDCPLKEIKN